MNEQGAIRKLSRAISNLAFGVIELPFSMDETNSRHGNSSSFSYGIVNGVGRSLARIGSGVYDLLTFPVPTNHGTYASILPPAVPWVQGGYEEFPPELGFESRMRYTRSQSTGYSRMP